jgi:transcriptional regulator with XRE-family HTH domain
MCHTPRVATSPTVRRLQLGRELKRLRESAGLPREAAATELECGVSKVGRIEAGKMTIDLPAVKALLALYKADEREAAEILDIAREARKRSAYRVPDWVRAYVGLEAEAVEIKVFQMDLVPGLLQTEAYTREVTRAADPTRDPAEVERLVGIRKERQARLFSDGSPQLWVVLDESAIRRVVGGPSVMREQLERLLEVSRLPRVSLQVLPFEAGAYAAMGTTFTLLRLPEPPGGNVVCLEGLWSADYVDRPEHVHAYSVVFDRLCTSARDAASTVTTIEKAMGDLR